MKSSLRQWEEFISLHPEAHLLQSGAWGELKSAFGWKVERIIGQGSGAQILFRTLPGGFTIGYIPKGPLGESWINLVPEIDEVCRENRAIFLKVEPDLWEGHFANENFKEIGWKSSRPIQPRRTILIPISGSEDEILTLMKQKTRYNVRLAEKKEIAIKASEDLVTFYKMMVITGKRDGINIHALAYYQKAYDLFHKNGDCELLIAYYLNVPIAGIMAFKQGKTAWYMYGASTEVERNRMPTYLLQWETIRWAKEHGCEQYDLWGIPDVDEEELEKAFTKKHSHDGLWGVYRFKRGFGGNIARTAGAWDRVYFPTLYQVYLQIMKLRGKQED